MLKFRKLEMLLWVLLVVVHVFCLALRVFEAAFVGILSGEEEIEAEDENEESEEEIEAEESDAEAVPAVMKRPAAKVKQAAVAAPGAADKEKK